LKKNTSQYWRIQQNVWGNKGVTPRRKLMKCEMRLSALVHFRRLRRSLTENHGVGGSIPSLATSFPE
jgi:hypothetical protein